MTDTAACAMPAAGTPWYRQRWPWLLMLGPAIVVVAGIVTAVIAIETDDGLVADDYYKRGLAINQTLERAARTAVLGLTATPVRRDGHQPIIFMQCGPIRHTARAPAPATALVNWSSG